MNTAEGQAAAIGRLADALERIATAIEYATGIDQCDFCSEDAADCRDRGGCCDHCTHPKETPNA